MSREEILNQITERIFSAVTKSVVFIDQLCLLIAYEPASSFQDYFRKFKDRLDHMIYMKPVVALEFLSSIKPLLKYDSIYKDNLIITLKKSIYQRFNIRFLIIGAWSFLAIINGMLHFFKVILM